MTIETITRAALAGTLAYLDADGKPSQRAIAQFMRDALGRWGLCPRRELFKHARDQLRAGDISTDAVPRVLARLVALGECEEVAVGHELYIAPAEPRWVASGKGMAALLGVAVVPGSTLRVDTVDPLDVVVRVRLESEEHVATLAACGIREVTLAEWLRPLSFLHHAVRRAGNAIRIDRCDLAMFWECLDKTIGEEGIPLGPEAEVRAVVGEPGGFFGSYTADAVEGRWGDKLPDGVWCAYRRGHGDGHWLPTLVSVDGDERRSLDLFDNDEWRWALLARSLAVGPSEVSRRSDGAIAITWPLPTQLRAAMDIVGTPDGAWRWRVAEDTPDLWTLLS